MEWVDVGAFADLARRRKATVEAGGRTIALFVVDGRVHALDNTCIHKQREISKGVILNGRIVCPGHQWAFDLETGHEARMDRYQPCFPVRVEDGRVLLWTEPNPVPAPVGQSEPADERRMATEEVSWPRSST